jgi:hypothetical protein
LRPVVVSTALRQGRARIAPDATDEDWLRLFGASMITGAALMEGAAFFFLVVYMLGGHPWTLAGGVAMLALLAYFHFPIRDSVKRWLAEQKETAQTTNDSM